MNKCPKCGAEFEGKFCPACGEKWEDEKICPKCGAKQNGSARFCNECGYSFVVAATGNQGGQQFQSDTKHKVFSALQIVPFVVFVLFSILLFAFYAAPVAEMILGMGFPNESLGNVYGYKTVLSDIPQLNGSMIMLFILLIFGIVFSCVMGITQVKKDLKYKEIKTGKCNVSLPALLGYISFIFYLIMLIVGIAIVITISSADEGMGILAAGACPILLIVFSIVFAAISAGALVARYLLAKNSPELKEAEAQKKEQYFESERLRKEQFYATHSEPVAPVAGEDKKANKRAAVIYKHKKRRYDKAIEKPAPAAVIWFDLHKIAIIMLAIILAVAIILIYFFVPVLTNKFRISVVEKIQLGYTQEQVTEILGEPDDITDNYTSWEYYSDDYSSILVKIQKNNDEQEKAFEKGDEKKLFQLANEETKLKEQLKKVNYDFIEIGFKGDKQSGYAVSSVYFEKDCCDSAENTSTKKEVEKVELSAEEAGYYSDYTGGQKEQKLIDYNGQLYYSAYYTDGAFYRGYIKNETAEIIGKTADIKWSDKFSDYEASINVVKIGEVKDDAWFSTYKDHGSFYPYFSNIKSITIPDGVTSIGSSAFYNCTSLASITIPEGVTSIGDGAFYGCANLESVTIPDGVTSIGTEAFKNCTSLESITIPNSVTSIGDLAFKNCTSLESITIPDSVTSIGEDAFYGCTELIQTQDGVQYVDKWVVDCDISITTVNLRADTKGIADYAFYECTSLKSITIPNSVTSIGRGAFNECTSLKSITIPASVTSIGDYAFYYCKSLESITIPDSVTSIGRYAFEDCKKLESITIPESVTSIGKYAFSGCTSLKEVTFKNTKGWKVSKSSDMSNAQDITVTDATQNAKFLTDTYSYYYWQRYDD